MTCTPVIKEDTKLRPDYYTVTVPKNQWVMFPYEYKNSEKKSIQRRSKR